MRGAVCPDCANPIDACTCHIDPVLDKLSKPLVPPRLEITDEAGDQNEWLARRCPKCGYSMGFCVCGMGDDDGREYLSNHEMRWLQFGGCVAEHIHKYVIPQYGDHPNDTYATSSKSELDGVLMKYVQRQRNGGGARGKEEMKRDYLKIAHMACLIYNLITAEETCDA